MSTRARVVAALALAVLAGGLLTIATGGASRDGTYTITARFVKAIGLFAHSDVRVLGVTVGEVTSVTPKGDHVEVTMEIDSSRKVPVDAGAIIVPISLISDRYIQLAPPYSSGPALSDGAAIGIERTTIPAELDDLLAGLQKFLEALEAGRAGDPGAIGEAITNLAGALEGTGEDLDRTLGATGEVAEVLVDNSERLDGIVVHLSRLLQALSERRTDITALNANLAGSLGAIASEQAALDGALRNLAVLTEQLGGVVRDNRATLEADLDILARTTQAVLRHQDSLVRSNDWIHVVADGAEYSHNGGAVHVFGGITHVDVRDSHAACPFGPALCAVLGLPGP